LVIGNRLKGNDIGMFQINTIRDLTARLQTEIGDLASAGTVPRRESGGGLRFACDADRLVAGRIRTAIRKVVGLFGKLDAFARDLKNGARVAFAPGLVHDG
jgi:hypothetical protein